MPRPLIKRISLLAAALLLIVCYPIYQPYLNHPKTTYDAPWVYPSQNPTVAKQINGD